MFFRFGRAVISDLGMLNGVNNSKLLMSFFDYKITKKFNAWGNYPKNIGIALKHSMFSSS